MFRKGNMSPKSFRPDVPADIWPRNSVRPSKDWQNKYFRYGHAEPSSREKLRSEKIRADFPFPIVTEPIRVQRGFLVAIPRGLSGPSGPRVPGSVSESVPENGVVPRSVPRGVPGALRAPGSRVSKKCPESVPGVSGTPF